ncbi:MAG: hypothetical protein ABI598_04810 [Chloroflexota bacterium]
MTIREEFEGRMSFLDRAKVAAGQVADQAKQAAETARQTATEQTARAQAAMSDPATAERARGALLKAKRRVATAIDRIDPNVLADVIIKATALQERANASLKAKGSPYRISEVGIGAAIPPSVTFAIARSDDPAGDGASNVAVSSTELLATLGVPGEGSIQALDGTIHEDLDPGEEGA